jgi:Transposase IS66 family
VLEPLAIRPDTIADPAARQAVIALLNLVEQLQGEVASLRAENQRQREEIARLKGERGRPNIPPNKPTTGAGKPPTDHSSEQERCDPKGSPKRWQKEPKLPRLRIDRTVPLSLDPLLLPPDAVFKGYEEVVIQDLVLKTDNVCFRRQKYWSPSQRRVYLASLPKGYEGEFGPGLKSLALSLCYGALVSQPQIVAFLRAAGTVISKGQVAHLLTQRHERFHVERVAAVVAGLSSSPWQHTDVTPTRVDGRNEACHVLCNPLFTAYHTTPSADRLSVLEALQAGQALSFRLDAVAHQYLETVGLSQKQRLRLLALPQRAEWTRGEFEALLDRHLPGLGVQQRRWILEGAALAGYRAQGRVPVVEMLLCDDAPVYRNLAELSLCWVHDGRHYKKLTPWVPHHQQLLAEFRARYWAFYRELLAYREAPSEPEAVRLEAAFDKLFATQTGYWQLDERIERTQEKKAALLRVLAHPELPLHNNPAELGARRRVRKRDVSFGPRSEAGVRAWDTFQSLAATCQKLGVSFFHYLTDRLTGVGAIRPLADLIADAARTLNLGTSWSSRASPGY